MNLNNCKHDQMIDAPVDYKTPPSRQGKGGFKNSFFRGGVLIDDECDRLMGESPDRLQSYDDGGERGSGRVRRGGRK